MCWNSSRNSADCSFESHFDCEHSSQSDFAFVFGHKEPGVVEAAEDSPSKMFFKDHKHFKREIGKKFGLIM